ncbi:PREDICTED: probable E3 ubiquitin-protein ligase TRIML2 [Dipodomys ordii]|uniref:Probable E3 ubiquitin-protein ligase TRIML2 n=1 Tax=Dipodomys ordii TaxID=10020 RepID=A0A1S3FS89_DIPOR|nr:PREDICTED: probable E3 ubiquitin-protein ligase TRIML2 [Dipodomys ordii]
MAEDEYCEVHQEPLCLFCDEDQITLCNKCFQSPEHHLHLVYGIQEAAEKSRKLFQEILTALREKLEVARSILADEQERMKMIQEEEQNLKEIIESEYGLRFRLLTEENELSLLRLQGCKFDLNLRKAKQNQQIRFSTELEKSQEALQALLLLLKHYTVYINQYEKSQNGHITLDPETAHPCLVLSKNLKSVRLRNIQQDVPGKPWKCDFSATVCAAESFSSGKHYWEVNVAMASRWQLGICSVTDRKGNRMEASGNKVLLMGSMMGTDYTSWVFPPLKKIYLGKQMHRVGVFLDYEYGQLSFYDVTESSLIYHFSHLTFQGNIKPVFALCTSSGDLNSDSLTV